MLTSSPSSRTDEPRFSPSPQENDSLEESRRTLLDELEADPFLFLATLFPDYVTEPFATFHGEFWAWVWAIEKGLRPSPFVGVWPRGAAKSTNAEMAIIALGARKARSYVLYVCETQEQADQHVANIAAMLESPGVEAFYPDLAARGVGKYGNPKGWRRNRLVTASGLVVDALGLDSAARGAKFEAQRPDLIVVDDVDSENDSTNEVAKKVKALTRKVLPAGSTDLAVLAIQNLVHPDSIFSQLVDGRADFLADRIISGPFPAVYGLEYERTDDGRYEITAGVAGWSGQDLVTCQDFIDTFGLTAFLAEMQHDVEPPPGGMFDHLVWQRVDWDQMPVHQRRVVWCDPAVTDKDQSDSQGICAAGLGVDGKIYVLWSWEQRTSPLDAILRALRKAIELEADEIGIETDQGGDTWDSVVREAMDIIRKGDRDAGVEPYKGVFPRFADEKAGQGYGPKNHRASKMLAWYETGRMIHARGTHAVLEKALRRFPLTKPLDLVDAEFWAFNSLSKAPTKRRQYKDLRHRAR